MTVVIILDLDHTLIHAKKKEEDQFNDKNRPCHIDSDRYYVYLRPHIYRFLDSCFRITPHVILWTAATESYVKSVINFLTELYSFFRVITRDTFGTTTKNVDLLMGDPIIERSMVIFVDDIVRRIQYTVENVIVMEIEKFMVENKDDVLTEVLSDIEVLCC